MKLSDITNIIQSMKGRMPESSRTLLAHKFMQVFAMHLTQIKSSATLQEWADNGGPTAFFRDCELLSGAPACDHNINIHDTDLATFINRWATVNEWKHKDGEFRPFTQEMSDLRETMVKELNALYEAQKRVTEHERKSQDTSEVQEPE